MTYKILKTDGKTEAVPQAKLVLEQMQKVVGGYIEYFEHHGETYICNEDGISLGLPRNPHFIDTVILGDVILVRKKGK